MELIEKNAERYRVSILAYCLIPNHYHLFVRQNSDIPLSRFIQTLTNVFVQAMNNQLKRKGTLFEGRAIAKLIDKDAYFLHMCRYIHLNPIKHNLVTNLDEWKYSNYHNCIDEKSDDSIFIKKIFGSCLVYKEFVEDYTPTIEEMKNFQKYAME
jgi:REP element-mobilizing transposase RayT